MGYIEGKYRAIKSLEEQEFNMQAYGCGPPLDSPTIIVSKFGVNLHTSRR